MSRLLLVNQSVGYLFADIVNVAVKDGHHVTLFSGKIDADLPNGVEVRTGCHYLSNSIWQRMRTWMLFSAQLWWHIFWYGRKYDALLVVTNPPFAPLMAWMACRPYALLLYDLYPQVLRDMGYLSHTNWMYRLWWVANGKALRAATKVFTLSNRMATELKDYYSNYSSFETSVEIIPPWANHEMIFSVPKSDNPFVKKYRLEDCFVVLYSGNMGLTHPSLEDIVSAARLLADHPLIQFIFIGNGPKRSILEQSSRGLKNVHFMSPLPMAELKYSLSAASVAVIALEANASGASVPSKTYNALAAGTPLLVLSGPDAEVAILAEKEDVGIFILPGNPVLLAQIIKDLASDPERLNKMKVRAANAAEKFTPANALKMINCWLSRHS